MARWGRRGGERSEAGSESVMLPSSRKTFYVGFVAKSQEASLLSQGVRAVVV